MNKKVIFVIIWMILIFIFSNQPAIASTKQSNRVVNVVSKITKIDTEKLITPVRKCAHLFLYFMLGILVYISLTMPDKKFIIALIVCALYACSDELHQTFIQGRSGEIKDVLIDTCGSLLGITLITFLSPKK